MDSFTLGRLWRAPAGPFPLAVSGAAVPAPPASRHRTILSTTVTPTSLRTRRHRRRRAIIVTGALRRDCGSAPVQNLVDTRPPTRWREGRSARHATVWSAGGIGGLKGSCSKKEMGTADYWIESMQEQWRGQTVEHMRMHYGELW